MTIREFVEKCSLVTKIGITKCGDEDALYPYKIEDFDAIGFNRQILEGARGRNSGHRKKMNTSQLILLKSLWHIWTELKVQLKIGNIDLRVVRFN